MKPWIVIFPGMTADAPVYASEAAARAMVERTNAETAGNVEAVAMPLNIAAAAPKLIELMFGMIDCGPGADTIPDDLHEARKAALKFLRELGEV